MKEVLKSEDDGEYLRQLVSKDRFEEFGQRELCKTCPAHHRRRCGGMYNARDATIYCRRQIAQVAYKLHRQPTVSEVLAFFNGNGHGARSG